MQLPSYFLFFRRQLTDRFVDFVFFQVNIAQQQQVQLLQNEMDKLRSDNLKLYEKIKFLQGYSKGKVECLDGGDDDDDDDDDDGGDYMEIIVI